jgi:hypothetical protein
LTGCLRLFDTSFLCVNTCNNVYYMYNTEWILEGSSNCCLNFALHYNSNYWIGILPMVFWPPYPWYFDHPYPWYIDLTNYGILTPLSMVFWTPYPWYIKPHTYGLSTPLPMVFWPPTHGLSYGIMNSFLLEELRGVNLPWGGSKYNDKKSTPQNTMLLKVRQFLL